MAACMLEYTKLNKPCWKVLNMDCSHREHEVSAGIHSTRDVGQQQLDASDKLRVHAASVCHRSHEIWNWANRTMWEAVKLPGLFTSCHSILPISPAVSHHCGVWVRLINCTFHLEMLTKGKKSVLNTLSMGLGKNYSIKKFTNIVEFLYRQSACQTRKINYFLRWFSQLTPTLLHPVTDVYIACWHGRVFTYTQ